MQTQKRCAVCGARADHHVTSSHFGREVDFCRHHGAQFYRPAWFNLVLRAKQDVALRLIDAFIESHQERCTPRVEAA